MVWEWKLNVNRQTFKVSPSIILKKKENRSLCCAFLGEYCDLFFIIEQDGLVKICRNNSHCMISSYSFIICEHFEIKKSLINSSKIIFSYFQNIGIRYVIFTWVSISDHFCTISEIKIGTFYSLNLLTMEDRKKKIKQR